MGMYRYFAKVGNPKKIVTNYYQGGKLVTMDKLYAKMGLTEDEPEERIDRIGAIGLTIANCLMQTAWHV